MKENLEKRRCTVAVNRAPQTPDRFPCADEQCPGSGLTKRTGRTERNGLTRRLRCNQCHQYWDWVQRFGLADLFPLFVGAGRWTTLRQNEETIRYAAKVLVWGEGFHEAARTVTVSEPCLRMVRKWVIQWRDDEDFFAAISSETGSEDGGEPWTPSQFTASISWMAEYHRCDRLVLAAKRFCSALRDSGLRQIGGNVGKQLDLHNKLKDLIAKYQTTVSKLGDRSEEQFRSREFKAQDFGGFYSPLRSTSALSLELLPSPKC